MTTNLTDFDSPHPGVVAIAVARSSFNKLCADGTIPRLGAPVPVDPNQVNIATSYLRIAKPKKKPTAFFDDVADSISLRAGDEVSNGATMAACVALSLTVRTGTESACLLRMR